MLKKRYIIRTFLVTMSVGGALLVLRSSTRQPETPSSCKESLEECPKSPQKSGKMIWENLSQQFFSSI